MQEKIKRRWTRKPEESDAISEVHPRYGNSVSSLRCARINKSIYIIVGKEKTPITSYPAAKHPNHNKFAITDMREKPAYFSFYWTTRASTSAPPTILLTYRCFCKSFSSCRIYDSLVRLCQAMKQSIVTLVSLYLSFLIWFKLINSFVKRVIVCWVEIVGLFHQ